MQLLPHPATKIVTVETIDAAVWQDGDRWHFRYLVEGIDDLVVPDTQLASRTSQLWKHTCFEAFVGLPAGGYFELNFSPSSQWGLYRFDGPRSGMRDAPGAIEIWLDAGETWLALEAAVECKALKAGSPLGLSAVIEESKSTSYWALGHSDDAPDFHDRACFLARLTE